ncbi:hypothetical protein PIB30_112260, partial [Stylosanthes scabra]|nr:hypothetical protein [Stylosanthes scabra]
MKFKGKGRSSSSSFKKDLSKIICHHCKEAGYYKTDCPKLKKEEKGKKGKNKVLLSSCEDLENDTDSDEEQEQEPHACFMASNDELEEVSFNDLSNEDMQVIIDDLTAQSIKLFEKYNKCKSEIVALKNENDFLKEKLKENE